jgi:hypothetical protein
VPQGSTPGPDEEGAEGEGGDNEKGVELVYYAIGTPPADLDMVTRELSRMTRDKINVKTEQEDHDDLQKRKGAGYCRQPAEAVQGAANRHY